MSVSRRQFEVIKVGDFVHRARRTRSESTVKQYIWSLKKFDEWLDENNRKPDEKSLDDFLIYLSKQGQSKASQSKHFSAIKVFFERELGAEIDLENPRVERKSVVEGKDYPNPKDVQKVVESVLKKRDKAIIATTFDLGARRGEVVSLDKNDYRPPIMVVSRKKTRGKPERHQRRMSDKTLSIIDEYLEARTDDHPALFVTYGKLNKGEPKRISGEAIRLIVGKWTDRVLGISYRPHSLRHSRASQMARAGFSIKYIAEFLGITTQTADRIYSHLTSEDLKKVPPALE